MRDKLSPGIFVSPRLVLFLVTAVVLIYGVIYPNLYVLAASFQRSGSWTLANYRDVLTQRTVIEAIVNSLGLAVATVLLCSLVGIPLAFYSSATRFPGDSYLRCWRPCRLTCRRLWAQLPSFFSAANRVFWLAAFRPSCIYRLRPGHYAAGRRCCSFTPTRCTPFSTY